MDYKKLFGVAISSAFLMNACSDDSSSSSQGPSNPDIDISACVDIEDANLRAQIDDANKTVLQAIENRNNYENLKFYVANAEETFHKALNAYPNSCEAQFGLAVTLLANTINNSLVDSIYRVYESGDENLKLNLFNVDVGNYAGAIVNLSANKYGLINDRVQSTVVNTFIPKTDSAIALLQNVKSAGNFLYSLDNDGERLDIDEGDLDVAIGAVQAVNALLTAVASFNLDASLDDSYNWVKTADSVDRYRYSFENLNANEQKAIKQAISLLEKSSPFTTVKNSWKDRYKKIPEALDSAVENVKAGLTFKMLNAGKNPYSAFNVGFDEESDISANDIQKSIDICDSIQKGLHGIVKVQIHDSLLAVNIQKFFEITEGIQDYYPYHKIKPIETWTEFPKTGFDWRSENWDDIDDEDSTILAEYEIMSKFRSLSNHQYGRFYIYARQSYTSDTVEYFLDYYSDDGWESIKVYLSSCNYAFETDEFANTNSAEIYTFSDEVCQVKNGDAYYKVMDISVLSDVCMFSDKNGNKTANALEIIRHENKTPDYYARTVIFPDPTFGGVFPEMTQEKLGKLIYYIYDFDEEEDDESIFD